jgi:hypothetical protein
VVIVVVGVLLAVVVVVGVLLLLLLLLSPLFRCGSCSGGSSRSSYKCKPTTTTKIRDVC